MSIRVPKSLVLIQWKQIAIALPDTFAQMGKITVNFAQPKFQRNSKINFKSLENIPRVVKAELKLCAGCARLL